MEIKTVGIVGCGLMGSGIVELVAKNGYQVVVREVDDGFLKKGLDRLSSSMGRAVERGKLTAADREAAWARIKGTTRMADLAQVDLASVQGGENRAQHK